MLTEEKFTGAVERYMDTVYRLALSYMRDGSAAEDVTQEVFLRLLRGGGKIGGEEHLKHWLIRVTVNECKRALSSPWRSFGALEENIPLPESEGQGRELYMLVTELPEKYRVVLHLHYFEGYSTDEIAALLRRPGATVRSQLSRAKKMLKQKLEEAENV